MLNFRETSVMPPKKPAPKVGRPAEPKPLKSLVSMKGTDDFEAWLDDLVDHARQGTRTLLLKNALAEYAENHGFKRPQPKR
jgi:hypothetical protein